MPTLKPSYEIEPVISMSGMCVAADLNNCFLEVEPKTTPFFAEERSYLSGVMMQKKFQFPEHPEPYEN